MTGRLVYGDWAIVVVNRDGAPWMRLMDGPYVRGWARTTPELAALLRGWRLDLADFAEDERTST